MVKKTSLIILLSLLNCSISYANQAIFTATVNKKNFAKNEQIILTVTLQNKVTKNSPNIQLLYQNGFALKKQSRSQQTKIINNNYQITTNWQYILTSNNIGKIILPSISLETDTDILNSKEIEINISDQKFIDPVISKDIYIKNSVTKKNLYLKESFIYKVTITRFIDIINASLTPPISDQAIIKEIFSEKSTRKIINNREAIINNYYYLVTPHQAGKTTIKPAILNGAYLDNNNMIQAYNPFANFNSFSDNYKDFTVSGQKYIIDILPKQYKDKTWLAVKNLELNVTYGNKLNDIITNNKQLNIGEPVTIKIGIKAHNITDKELPNLSLGNIENVKIYQDNPKTNTKYDFNNKTITATKFITFTLIANQAGLIEIPQINLTWWNVIKEQKEIAKINEISFSSKEHQDKVNISVDNKPNQIIEINNKPNYLLLISLFINILLIIIISLMRWSNLKKNQLNYHLNSDKKTKDKKNHINYCQKLDSAINAKEVHDFIIDYFAQNYQLKTDNLTELSKELESIFDKEIIAEINIIFITINNMLYAKKNFEQNIKLELQNILSKLAKKKNPTSKKSNNKNDFTLNPF